MKKKLLALFLAFAMVLPLCPAGVLSFPVAAATSGKTGDCTWKLNGTELTISGNGAMGNYSTIYKNGNYVTDAPWGTSITEVIIGNGVTSIGGYAFFNCTGLTSVTIGNGVESIGDRAFFNCTGLTNITIPDSVTSIGDKAFFFCTGLTSVTIGKSVTSIGSNAFVGCERLTSITIPNSVTSIGQFAFGYCTALTSIVVEENNPKYHSAGNCLIETASKMLLYGCKNSVIPADGTVTSIGDWAFERCTGLTSITIPDSVTSIGSSAFSSCSGLTSIVVEENNPKYHSAGNCLIETASKMLLYGCKNSVIPADGTVEIIGKYAFYGCTGLTSITIPNSVTTIGNYAFYDCSSLTSVTIGNGVTSIGECAFSSCSGLTSITIGDSVTSIGDKAFSNCSGLTSVTIGNGVTSIGDRAFIGCTGLTSVTIPNSVTTIANYAFSNCTGLSDVWYEGSSRANISIGSSNSYLTSATWHYNSCLENAPNYTHSYDNACDTTCNECGSVRTVPGHVYDNICDTTCNVCGVSRTAPHDYDNTTDPICNECGYVRYDKYGTTGDCFWYLKGTELTISGNGEMGNYSYSTVAPWGTLITKVVIGNGVESIGDYAFSFCTGLTSITIPNSVTTIGSSAFSSCSKLTSVTIGNSVTTIGDGAFYGCSGLTSITIPDGVTSIGDSAFYGCSKLASITVDANNGYYSSQDGVLFNKNKTTLICYPAGKTATSYTIPNSVTIIGDYAFRGCTGLTSITIPNSVTTIGSSAFFNCTGLTSITIPNSVTTIGSSAFSGCDGLTSIIIPNSVTEIWENSICGCKNLTSITIGSGVTGFWGMGRGSYPFSGCDNLSSITVAKGNPKYHSSGNCLIETASKRLIAGCKSSVIPADGSVTSVGFVSFEGCTGLTSIVIPDSVCEIFPFAFSGCTGLTSIAIPDSVKSVSDYAFSGCTGLTSVTIGNSVTTIGNSAFSYCTKLTNVYYRGTASDKQNIAIGSDNSPLTSATWYYNACIGSISHSYDNACDITCNECGAVREVPDHIYTDSHDPDCNECGFIRYSAYGTTNDCFWYLEGTHLVITGNGRMANYSATNPSPWKNLNVTSLTIEDGVTLIGTQAFSGLAKIEEVVVPDSVGVIRFSAFSGCNSLKKITLPFVGQSIDAEEDTYFGYIFGATSYYENSSYVPSTLKEVVLTKVNTIGTYTFSYCTKLASITVDANNGYYSSQDGVLFNKNKTTLICYPAGKTATSYTIPNSVTTIGEGAFSGCTGLTSITIPDSVTSIGDCAFSDCSNLSTVYYRGTESDKQNIAIGSDNSPLTSATWYYNACIGAANHSYDNACDTTCNVCGDIRIVPAHVYDNACDIICNVCGDIRTVPDHIYSNACDTTCNECGKEREVPDHIYTDSHDPDCNECGFIRFDAYGATGDCNWYVKENHLTIYGNGKVPDYAANTAPWGKAITSAVIEEGVEAIGSNAFRGCSDLISIAIPKSVASIGNSAFYNCYYLSDVWYGGSEADFEAILIGSSNSDLKYANWNYNACIQNAPSYQHTYTHACDTACNVCGAHRTTTVNHSYTNAKDPDCNECGYVRFTIGDADGNGETSDWDGIVLARYLAGWDVEIPNPEALDLDGDGEITDWDGVLLDRILAGWDIKLG